ncbi:hypothetical protein LWI29_027657 [Acer saccharum]|uniref:EF-hand domain-containing protein n=1 Tax=Acer saccharum TaxID=4024 RepID=A0AA39SEP4_ACESA|nr:hypothetical protein LWI29_027657 [Acer saccharum]
MTSRLMILFPLIDNAPKDGVGFEELEAWNAQVVIDRLSYLTQKEMELSDKNGDGEVYFQEYLPHFSQEDIVWPTWVAVAVSETLRMVVTYVVTKSARELLFIIVSQDEKYKAKAKDDNALNLDIEEEMGEEIARSDDERASGGKVYSNVDDSSDESSLTSNEESSEESSEDDSNFDIFENEARLDMMFLE